MTKLSMLILGSLAIAAAISLAVLTPRGEPRTDVRPQLTSAQATELKTSDRPAPPPPAARAVEEDGGADAPADYADAQDGHGS